MSNSKAIIYSLLSGLCLGLGWLTPMSYTCGVLGWLTPIFFILMLKSIHSKGYICAFLSGCLACSIGFYWLIYTFQEFGGYNFFLALIIYAIFVTTASIQYLITVFLYRHLNFKFLKHFSLQFTFAWCVSEFITFKVFPWNLGHMQLAFNHLIQVADIGGVYLISFIVCWLSESVIDFLRDFKLCKFAAPLLFIFALIYGHFQIKTFSEYTTHSQNIAIAQANLKINERQNPKNYENNRLIYQKLSEDIKQKSKGNTLIIWPESAIMELLYSNIKNANNDTRIPSSNRGDAFLIGALTVDRDQEQFLRYNSAMAIYPDATIPDPYHKRILMPFGEYIPLLSTFPWLKTLNPLAANGFNAGTSSVIFNYPMLDQNGNNYNLKLSPLICYEEIIPSLALTATKADTQLLVSLSFDAWFGDSVAPLQQHTIAAFRAIENRRYLIRATDKGFSAIVNPIGQTVTSSPNNNKPTLLEGIISPLEIKTLYTSLGNTFYWFISLIITLAVFIPKGDPE